MKQGALIRRLHRIKYLFTFSVPELIGMVKAWKRKKSYTKWKRTYIKVGWLRYSHPVTKVDDYMKARLEAAKGLPEGKASIEDVQSRLYSDGPIMMANRWLVNGHSRAHAITEVKGRDYVIEVLEAI